MTLSVALFPAHRRGRLRPAAWMLSPTLWTATATGVLALSLLAAAVGPWLHGAPVSPEDDAEYYRIVAGHIAREGASTFDGLTLTNGYHPLWTWMLALQDRLFGPSFLITRLLETVLVAAAFPVFLRAIGLRSAVGVLAFLLLYGRLVAGLALTGMEVSALVGATALVVLAALPTRRDGAARGVMLGAAAATAVLARLDAAVFILPLVAFAPLRRRTRLVALATAGAVGAAYVGYNLLTFGVVMPVSSSVKSLGGLQLNRRLVDELVLDWRTGHLTSRYVQTGVFLALGPVLLLLSRRDSLGRALAGAVTVGGLLFAAKLLFGSSWRIWPWYNFPVLFGLLAAAAVAGPALERWAQGWNDRRPAAAGPAAVAALALAALGMAGLTLKAARVALRPALDTSLNRFDELDRIAAARWAPVLRGAPVAMGDRAGAFAAAYTGPVVQLEGLVADAEYLRLLKARADVTPYLCRRGVRFVLAYRPELGDYRAHRMPVLRTTLTQYAGPSLTLRREDEVGRLQDRRLLDLRGVDEADDTLYLWRLSACSRPL